jgi:hypothetical protein
MRMPTWFLHQGCQTVWYILMLHCLIIEKLWENRLGGKGYICNIRPPTTDHQLGLIRSEITNRDLRKNIFEQKKTVGNPVLHHHVRKRDSSFARMNLN